MSALTQAAVYGAYFLMALPAGWIIRKWGYRRGVITGLVLFGFGALMLFLYVAAQTGVNSFFINYAEESIHIEKQTASLYLAFGEGELIKSHSLKPMNCF